MATKAKEPAAPSKKHYFHDGSLTIPPWHINHRNYDQKVPRELGEAIDLLDTLTKQRKDLERQAGKIEEAEKKLKEHLARAMAQQNLKIAAGKVAKIRVESVEVPTIKDFDAMWAFIFKTKDKTLLQRRLSAEAINERWAAGKKVPGVEPFQVTKVFLSKA